MASAAPDDDPFALDAVGEQQAQRRPEGRGDGDDEGVAQACGHLDAAGDQQGRHPAGKAVIARRLEQVEGDQHQGAAQIGRLPYLPKRAAFPARGGCARWLGQFGAFQPRFHFPGFDDGRRLPRCGHVAASQRGLSGSRRRTNQTSTAPADPAITTKRQPSRPNTVRGTSSQPRNATSGMAANWMMLA